MAQIQVTASELKAKAGELRELNNKFKSSTGNLESQEGELVGMWEGEARNAFDEYIEKIHTLLNAQIYGEEESGCTGSCATCAGCH